MSGRCIGRMGVAEDTGSKRGLRMERQRVFWRMRGKCMGGMGWSRGRWGAGQV